MLNEGDVRVLRKDIAYGYTIAQEQPETQTFDQALNNHKKKLHDPSEKAALEEGKVVQAN